MRTHGLLLEIVSGVRGVPVFFLLSGYLAARKVHEAKTVGPERFFREKIRTLVIPFLFWNTLILSLVFFIKGIGLEPLIRGQGGYLGVGLSVSSILAALLGIGRWPIVWQFWFLRDLIVVTAVGFLIVRYLPPVPLLPWLLFFVPIPMASSLAYYLLGLQLRAVWPIESVPPLRSNILYCVGWLLMGAGVAAGTIVVPYPLLELGSAAFILSLALIASSFTPTARFARLGPAMFFVYATHEPLQSILASLWQAAGMPGYGSLVCFLLIPAASFLLCTGAHRVVGRIAPRALALATGGR